MASESNAPQGDKKFSSDKEFSYSQNAANSGPVPPNWIISLPTGTVTFLFTDIEGSTPRWERQPEKMAVALEVHNATLRYAIQANGGCIFKFIGDEYQAAFPTAPQGLQAAIDAQQGLSSAPWNEVGPLKVRMGLHTGEANLDPQGDEYAVSHTFNRAGRVRDAAHGGQILLSQEAADLVERSLPEGVLLRDLGNHRLKGLSYTEHLFQVVIPGLQVDFPPLRTLETCPNNLPVQLTSFVGREKESAEVERLLQSTRLLTLSGVGGTGKTRLALRVAEEIIPEFEQGTWLVELARLTDPALILPSVAAVFGLFEENESMPLQARLHNYLRDKHLLLILDNCEHLIAEAAQFVDALLHAAPKVKVMVTSREALGLAGELAYPVPSLAMPDPANLPPIEALRQYDAIRLFTERAGAVLPLFAMTEANAPTVVQICQRLDGIPLAIELAAARVKALPVEQINARLGDRFRLLTGGSRTALPRQQTLRATIDWSYGLLPEAERALLRMLSVFKGGWGLEAAEAVCTGCAPGEAEVFDLLAQLVNKSLVEAEITGGEVRRYRLLETIRQYAQEKLDEAGEAAWMRDRHLDYFLDLSEDIEKSLRSLAGLDRNNDWVKSQAVDLENFRAAMNWAFGNNNCDKVAQGVRLASNLLLFWQWGNLCGEGLAWVKKGLALLAEEDEQLILVRAKALRCAGELSNNVDSNRDACLLGRESERLYRQCEDPIGLAYALIALTGCVGYLEPDHPLAVSESDARCFVAESEPIFRQAGESLGLLYVLGSKIGQLINDKENEAAEALIAEYQSINRGTPWEGVEDWFWARIARAQGDLARSLVHYQKMLEYSRRQDNIINIAWISVIMGEIALELKQVDQAQSYFQEALAPALKNGSKSLFSMAMENLVRICLSKGQYQQAGAYLLMGLSLAPEMDPEDFIGRYLLTLIKAAERILPPAAVTRLLGYIETNTAIFHGGWESYKLEYQQITAAVQARQETAAFKAAWEAGQCMTREQALAEARAVAEQLSSHPSSNQA